MSGEAKPQLGRVVGEHFKIIDMLGKGGMATVYKGTDLRTQETVAVKLLKPEVIQMDAGLVERFEREGEALRRLNHPNIVKMLGAFSEDEEHHYVVMEYVTGGDLRQLLKGHRKNDDLMPIERLLNIALDLSDALTRAHRLGIVHRDIKPANVLIAEDGTPRLTDFGVAHFSDSTRVTQTGAMVGTLAYLSPEACLGKSVDTRADIWSFGVMLYEMLALKQPFKEANTAALLTAIMTKEPQISIDEIRSDAPPELIALVKEMLIKDREDRIASVRLVGARLEAIISNKGQHVAGEIVGVETLPTSAEVPSLADIKSAVSLHDKVPDGNTLTPLPSLTASDVYSASASASTNTRSGRVLPPIGRRAHANPRVFICYRPNDAPALAGRIHDRLSLRFGENNLVKDVETKSLGVDVRQAIQNEVNNSDVMLVVVGKKWANDSAAVLDNPNDPIRLQLDAGLKRDDYLMIPLLVEGATMPSSEQLPASLQDLLQRQSAVIRGEPNFTNDMNWLGDQIEQVFQAKRPQRKQPYWLVGAALLAIILVVGVLAILAGDGSSNDSDDDTSTALVIDETEEASTGNFPAVQTVNPIRDGEYMVLIIPFETIGDVQDESSDFIREDLTQRLERDAPNSNIRIRIYPEPAVSVEHLDAIIEHNQPSLVITGRYDGELTEVSLKTGSLAQFPYNVLDYDTINEVVAVNLELTNVRTETIAINVLAGLSALYMADGDMFELGRTNVIFDTVGEFIFDEQLPFLADGSIASYWHESFLVRHDYSEDALALLDDAIALNVRNPLLYSARSVVHQIRGEFDESNDDLGTAIALAPDGWTFSEFSGAIQTLLTNFNPDDARGAFDELATLRPDDWFVFSFKGTISYVLGDLPSADVDIQQSLDLNPEANFPYPFAFGIAIRQGRLDDAQGYMDDVLERFPDPHYAYDILDASFGIEEGTDNPFTMILDAFGNFALRQWQQVIEVGEQARNTDRLLPLSDIHMMEGVAYCNLAEPNWEAAQQAYTDAYDRDPEFAFTLLLRAETHLALDNPRGALGDIQMVISHRQAGRYLPYMRAFREGDIHCGNFLDVNLADFVDPDAPTVQSLPPPQGEQGGQGQLPPRQQGQGGQGQPPQQGGNQSIGDQAEIDDFLDDLFPEDGDDSSVPTPQTTEESES